MFLAPKSHVIRVLTGVNVRSNTITRIISTENIYLYRGVIVSVNGLQHFYHSHPFQQLAEDYMLAV